MDDCIFCRIIRGEIPSDRVYEDKDIIAFKDINPAAPVHVLIVPRVHIADIVALASHDSRAEVMEAVLEAIPEVAKSTGVDQNGFRLISNYGIDGGQTVPHLHFHLIGGRKLGEKLI